jgi:hypothetical protein
MWCWRGMEKISWTDHVRNEEALLRVMEQRNILHEKVNGTLTGLVIFYVETALYDKLLKKKKRDRSNRKTMKKTYESTG